MKLLNPPLASDLMATARSFGNYDLAAALADLIDNSIKARSSHVEINFDPSENDVIVRIRDNGDGMFKDELIAAMRPASANPETERQPEDLGRFGWGLKSASLSQARVLTVVSWCNGSIHAARWDIDDIDDWSMGLFEADEAKALLDNAIDTECGTEIIWSRSDRLLDFDDNTSVDETLTHVIANANQKLSLVFHRYLSGESGRKFSIIVNGSGLKAIDPFMTSHDSTQTLDADTIHMANGARISVQPYILPHFSKLSIQEQEKLGGPEGMVRNQGFYVYRNMRLIIYGTWFRLVPHGELSQLTRVKIDLPNSIDSDWRITVDKSDAQLPARLKNRLRNVVKKFNRRSISVHRKKGVSLDVPARESIWVRNVKNGQIRYLVNRDHPMIANLLELDQVSGNADSVLRLLESYFPIDSFIADTKNNEHKVNQTPTSIEEFDTLIRQSMMNFLMECDGRPKTEEFLAFLKRIEPFASQWQYTESYVRENMVKQWGMTVHGN